jgi:class 3 adenylate cyclase
VEDFKTLLAVVGGVLSIVIVLFGPVRAYYKNQAALENAKIAEENRALQTQLSDAQREREDEARGLQSRLNDCEVQRDQLNDKISLIGRAGGAALALKAAIDAELQSVMKSFGASGGSIYVPVTGPRGNVQGLAFLSIEPFTKENQKLKNQIIPLRSLAGKCFVSGKSDLERDVTESSDHYSEADSVSNYATASTISVALAGGGQAIGVLQLLRKKGEPPFKRDDVGRIATLAEGLAKQVSEATRDVDGAKLLGLSSGDFSIDGTVLIFDLTNSACLFEELAASHALLLLNEYFERMCDVGFAAGGTLDTYMGDGALMRFNVPRELPDHEFAAVKAAFDMMAAFTRLRDERWLAHSATLAGTHLRVGVSTGPLVRATLGHSQVQHLTVLGHPLSVAAGLCDSAPRDRSVVWASEETVAAIRPRAVAEPVDPAKLGKSTRFTRAAYEITSLQVG